MNFENPLFLLPILVGPIFMIAGIVMLLFPPKKINYLYGYRTKNSMKNIDRWNFAQNYSAKIMIWTGFFFSLTSLIGCSYGFKGRNQKQWLQSEYLSLR